MKYFSNKTFFVILAVAVLASVWFVGGKTSKAQTIEGNLIEGERFDNIRIGKSTSEDVEVNYGSEYKLVNHRNYSFEMIYKNLGLSFYYCQNDPNKEIFVVEIEPPARVATGKGIVLGESNFADVLRLYGEIGEIRDGTLEYEEDGIYFYDAEETEGENSPDARTEPQVKTTNEPNQTPDRKVEMSEVVPDGEEVLDAEDEKINDDEVKIEKNAEGNRKESESKIVKRIELIEKGGLRQCDDKFSKK